MTRADQVDNGRRQISEADELVDRDGHLALVSGQDDQ